MVFIVVFVLLYETVCSSFVLFHYGKVNLNQNLFSADILVFRFVSLNKTVCTSLISFRRNCWPMFRFGQENLRFALP